MCSKGLFEALCKHRTRQQHKAESGINRFYKYKATFLATMEQRAEIAISLYKQFYTFAQLLGVLLANPRIPVSPTRKFLELEVWPVSRKFVPAKITNHRVELLQKRFLLM